MFDESGPPHDRIDDDDPNRCSICGGEIGAGVRTMHEDGGFICVTCARRMFPEETEEAERMMREFNEEPSSE